MNNGCFENMIAIERFCIDAYEAHVVEIDEEGNERAHSPFTPVDGLRVRAKVAAGVTPQGYISRVQAKSACEAAGKRLCSAKEYIRACGGPKASDWYPYGGQWKKAGLCNEGKFGGVSRRFGGDPNKWTYQNFNDPRLNQEPDMLAPTGTYKECVSPEGAYDMVGNLHEWIADSDGWGHGIFMGGYYGDAEKNGHGCLYQTMAHEPAYHDYSTGFRCCADGLSR
jgi:formylglycine-generating enzyme required for sulfatase activity